MLVLTRKLNERIIIYPRDRWTRVDCARNKSLASHGGDRAPVAPEVMLINGPSYTQLHWYGK